MIKYDFDLELELESVVGEDFEHESLSLEEIEALQALAKFLKKQLKKICRTQEGLRAIWIQRKQPESSFGSMMEDLFWKVLEELHKIQDEYLKQEALI